MAKAVYISPEYNPHSLKRDWGFFVETKRPDIFGAMSSTSFATLRQTLVRSLREIALAGHVISTNKEGDSKPKPSSPAKVTIDIPEATANALYNEVGLDVLTLALLADVPVHRPLHISHNSLIGHWRWLRLVWRTLVQTKTRPAAIHPIEEFPPDQILRDALLENRNNVAIAQLRQMFHDLLEGACERDPEQIESDKLYSFLANLTLFCPFIGSELSYQYGLVEAPWTKGSLK
ncbi:hypothetical protein [Thalassospira lucentensis]|uniref:hypothetical protein n=1 Tax=Thalassospira lucentensis TaxID=168935 RepID=UPI00142E88B4|nr:hypothetical protein [Thalassospira lucentensis]NIZ00731.1 hypothetical protein [Thalassospira lucentensis]